VVMEEGIGHQVALQVINVDANCHHVLQYFVWVSNWSNYGCTIAHGTWLMSADNWVYYCAIRLLYEVTFEPEPWGRRLHMFWVIGSTQNLLKWTRIACHLINLGGEMN
jgi:hypothetical protein